MKARICILFATLSLITCSTFAVPPVGSTFWTMEVDSNGVFVGVATNVVTANAIATSQQVAAASAQAVSAIASAAVSQSQQVAAASAQAVSAIASAAVSQATADAGLATGTAAQVSAAAAIASNGVVSDRVVAIETNHATAAQGAKADSAAQQNGTPITTNFSLSVSGGASLTGDVASLVVSSRVTIAVSSPLASIDYDSTAGGSGATLEMEYWHAGSWTNECIYPCYTGSLYYAVQGVGMPKGGGTDVTASNWVVRLWGHPASLNVTNDMRGTVLSVSTPTAPEHATPRKYVDDAVGAITPASWAQYDANGVATGKDGVDLAGKRLYLSPAYSILSVSSDGHCALQHNGRDVLTVQMDVQGCLVTNAYFGGTITLSVDTNTIQSVPWPEVCTDLIAGNWLKIADYASTSNGPFLDISFTNVWTAANFRVTQTGTNASTLVSSVTFVAPAIEIAGTNATWRTMDVLVPGGETNTIRYLGAP